MFDDIKEALTKEINVIDEQHNLVRAREYYRKNKEIVVPELYPISTNHVTFMTYITGKKITSAFKGRPTERAIMARKLFNVMTRDVIFSKSKVPIFHGDPHASNIFHVTANSENPYQIALLDWGLYGTLPRQDRIALMQLVIGVYLKMRNGTMIMLALCLKMDYLTLLRRFVGSTRSSLRFFNRKKNDQALKLSHNCWADSSMKDMQPNLI